MIFIIFNREDELVLGGTGLGVVLEEVVFIFRIEAIAHLDDVLGEVLGFLPLRNAGVDFSIEIHTGKESLHRALGRPGVSNFALLRHIAVEDIEAFAFNPVIKVSPFDLGGSLTTDVFGHRERRVAEEIH